MRRPTWLRRPFGLVAESAWHQDEVEEVRLGIRWSRWSASSVSLRRCLQICL